MTPERYQKILHWLNAHPAAKRLVILLNHWLPAVPFVCYPVLLVLFGAGIGLLVSFALCGWFLRVLVAIILIVLGLLLLK